MAKVGLNIAFEGYDGFLIIVWKEALTPLAEVGHSLPLAFPVDQVYTLLELNPVTHVIEFWRSDNGSSRDDLLRTWEIDASLYDESVVETYYYTVSGGGLHDPQNESEQLRDERLKGQTYVVSFEGTGDRHPGKHYIDRSDDGGGFDLLNGELFQAEQNLTVTVQKKETRQQSQGGVSSDYMDVKPVPANATFDATYYKKLVTADGSSHLLILEFPAFNTIPNTKAKFAAHTGGQQYFRLQFQSGDTIRFHGRNRNYIDLAKDDEIELLWKDGNAYVLHDGTTYGQIGEYAWGVQLEPNCFFRNGAEYNITDYQRFYDWIPASQKVDYATWESYIDIPYVVKGSQVVKNKRVYPYKGLFAVSGSKFRVPDSRNMGVRALKHVDGAIDPERLVQKPGGYQIDTFLEHYHKTNLGKDVENSDSGGSANDADFYTNDDNKQIYTEKTGGGETRMENEGLLPLIRR